MNNAGVNQRGALEQATTEDFDYTMAVNVRAAMILIQAFAPGMRVAGFGRIVNISSRAAMRKTGQTLFVCGETSISGSGGA